MDIAELRKKSESELQLLVKTQRELVRDLRFRIANKQHKDVREIRDAKKSIARILSVLKEKRVIADYQRVHSQTSTPKK
ncbi:MAG: 50S ribosomal protein L29 [Candidatus Kerfeldbacteria bacterium]|nr:50S ribosomal protein L29 [Candidatus Kerfeldbacteria bacterium]